MDDDYQSCLWCGEILDVVELMDGDLAGRYSDKFCSDCREERRRRSEKDD